MAGIDIVILTAFGVGRLISSSKERKQMKAEDEEIKKEGEREKKTEEEAKQKQKLDVDVKHHRHHHPLNEVEGDQEFVCGGCARSGQGRRYRCSARCGFELHLVCASSPVMMTKDYFEPEVVPEIVQTFAHREEGHVVVKCYAKVDIFDCGHCNNPGKGFRYRCESEGCECTLHPICLESPTRINSFMHPEHELELITRPFSAKCSFCNRGKKSNLNNRVYACKACKFYIHPTCTLWPHYLFHDLHPKSHPLQLIVSPNSSSSSTSVTCSTCKEKCNGSVPLYRCEICSESYHPLCLLRSTLNARQSDEKADNAFKKQVANLSEFNVEFVGIDHLGIIG